MFAQSRKRHASTGQRVCAMKLFAIFAGELSDDWSHGPVLSLSDGDVDVRAVLFFSHTNACSIMHQKESRGPRECRETLNFEGSLNSDEWSAIGPIPNIGRAHARISARITGRIVKGSWNADARLPRIGKKRFGQLTARDTRGTRLRDWTIGRVGARETSSVPVPTSARPTSDGAQRTAVSALTSG